MELSYASLLPNEKSNVEESDDDSTPYKKGFSDADFFCVALKVIL
jgi:hypothetical protein